MSTQVIVIAIITLKTISPPKIKLEVFSRSEAGKGWNLEYSKLSTGLDPSKCCLVILRTAWQETSLYQVFSGKTNTIGPFPHWPKQPHPEIFTSEGESTWKAAKTLAESDELQVFPWQTKISLASGWNSLVNGSWILDCLSFLKQ